MTCYNILHGDNTTTDTGNRLTRANPAHTSDGTMGGRIWDPVIPAPEGYDNRVFAPTLHDEYISTLINHIEQVCGIIAGHNLCEAILAGHSYEGMVITGAAAK